MQVRSVSGFVALMFVATLGASPALAAEDPLTEVRVFRTRNLDSGNAVTLLRSIFQARQIFHHPDTGTIVVRDRPRSLEAADKLLRELDFAPPRWWVDVVVVTGKRERVIRRAELSTDFDLSYGSSPGATMSVELSPGAVTDEAPETRYAIDVRIVSPGSNSFRFRQSGAARIEDGGRLSVLSAMDEPLRRPLAKILGLDGDADSVFLRFRRDD